MDVKNRKAELKDDYVLSAGKPRVIEVARLGANWMGQLVQDRARRFAAMIFDTLSSYAVNLHTNWPFWLAARRQSRLTCIFWG